MNKFSIYIFSYVLILFIFLTAATAFAQNGGTIAGKISELSSSGSMEFVNVVLMQPGNDKIIKREVSDARGNYKIEAIPDGNYYLVASFIGYQNFKTTPIILNANRRRVVVDIKLDGGIKNLDEVTVAANKPLYSNSIDRKVYDVSQDILAKSGSASEVLANVPLVQVDIDGNISLRNSTAMILINGKVSPLMGANAAAALQQMPANSIEKIEVITNPSAKYKPDGTGGIINIVLKKNVKRGLNGSVTGNIGNGDRYNGSVNLNYNPGKVNLFGSYSVKQDYRSRTSINSRMQTNPTTGATLYYQDAALQNSRPFSNVANLGFDYNPTEKTTFGVSGNFYLREMRKHDITTKLVRSENATVQDYDRRRENFEQEKNFDGTVYAEHSFKKSDHKIRLEFNIAHAPEVEDNHYTNAFRFPLIGDQLDNTLIKKTQDNKHAALSYENQISEHSKLEAGYDGQYNKEDLDFYGAAFNATANTFLTDFAKTNRFIYIENVHALYGTYALEFKKFGAMFGLRGEYSDITSKLITTNSSIPNQYFKIYPTLHLTYKLADHKELQINYSKRVRRPEADELNPFAEYADPTNVRVGNPYLLPEFIHSVALGYQWSNAHFSILPGIYYRYTYNRFTSITTPLNDSVLVSRQQNLNSDKALGADLVLTIHPNDKLNINLIPNVFYNQIDASSLGYSNKKSTVTWSANLNASYTTPWATAIQVNSNYRSARLTPQGKFLPSFVMNMGARHEVLKKKGAVYFTVSDIFHSQRQVAELQSMYLIQNINQRSNSRIVYFGMSYNFGATPKKKKDLQFDNGG